MVLTQDDRATLVFTDEMDFTLEIVKNCQNDRVYGPSKDIAPNRVYHELLRLSKKIMAFALVSWQRKPNIHFIDTQRAEVNSNTYMYINLLCFTTRLQDPVSPIQLRIPAGSRSMSYQQNQSGLFD